MDPNRSPSPTSTDVSSVMTKSRTSTTKRPRKRPTKRFLWQEDVHLRFVAAIFDLGLKNASPKALIPLMKVSSPDSGLTTEHLKSHLQKYRINFERSRREFKERCQRELKRSRKRQRRHDRRQLSANNKPDRNSEANGGENTYRSAMEGEGQRVAPFSGESVVANCPVDYVVPHPPTCSVVPAMPEFTDAQWRTFSMLMSAPPPDMNGPSIQVPQDNLFVQSRAQEELRMQMHQAMQTQMNLHRQMLTRKGELSHNLRQHAVEDCRNNHNYYAQESAYQNPWASAQQIYQQQLASHRLQQMRQYESPPVALPEETRAEPQTLPDSSLPSIIATQPGELVDAVGDDLSRLDPLLESDDLFDFLKA